MAKNKSTFFCLPFLKLKRKDTFGLQKVHNLGLHWDWKSSNTWSHSNNHMSQAHRTNQFTILTKKNSGVLLFQICTEPITSSWIHKTQGRQNISSYRIMPRFWDGLSCKETKKMNRPPHWLTYILYSPDVYPTRQWYQVQRKLQHSASPIYV